jgi:orotate phosphoribosyltransferase
MDKEQVLNEFRAAGALLEGHFILTSGLHSPAYLQCARVMMDAARAARLCGTLRDKVTAAVPGAIDLVVSPAMGGVVVGYEMGRQLGVPAIFFERVDGKFQLRRGFEIGKGTKCLMVEDIVTTGLSSRECIAAIKAHGGIAVGACCLIDRSGGAADLKVPLASLAMVDIPTFESDNVPDHLASIPAVKPGSRSLSA